MSVKESKLWLTDLYLMKQAITARAQSTRLQLRLRAEASKNASFVQRLGAYLIDIFLILLISSIVTMPFTSSNNYEKLSEETNKVVEEYTNGKIDMNTYMNRVSSISYDMARETGLSSIIMIAVYVLYFIVYQYYKKGQTVGKKLMKIRIESTDSDELSINAMLMRSFIINSILQLSS